MLNALMTIIAISLVVVAYIGCFVLVFVSDKKSNISHKNRVRQDIADIKDLQIYQVIKSMNDGK